MSQNTFIYEGGKTTQMLPLPSFPSREAVEAHLKSDPDIFRDSMKTSFYALTVFILTYII